MLQSTQKFDVVDFIIDYESGDLSNDEVITGFQYLIDTGLIRNLQGSYQRMAQGLINEGYCSI
jgi:hypothetical protein